ncbi:TfoX/Sxy family protein [Parapedobacter sp.]
MAYDIELAHRVRDYLQRVSGVTIEEKKMFGGLAFLVNAKMCINVTAAGLMCRFDPSSLPQISKRPGYQPMVMRGKRLPGYCYVGPEGYNDPDDFTYWVELCLAFNEQVGPSKTR